MCACWFYIVWLCVSVGFLLFGCVFCNECVSVILVFLIV